MDLECINMQVDEEELLNIYKVLTEGNIFTLARRNPHADISIIAKGPYSIKIHGEMDTYKLSNNTRRALLRHIREYISKRKNRVRVKGDPNIDVS